MTPAALHPLLEELPTVFRGEDLQRRRLNDLLTRMLAEYNRGETDQFTVDNRLLAGCLYQILFTMHYDSNAYVPGDHTDERITRIVHYINEHYDSITDVEAIAQEFYISKYHLCRVFRKAMGVTVNDYLNQVRVKNACGYLESSDKSILEISQLCGFRTPAYFSNLFKKQMNISPSEYRLRKKARVLDV